MSSDQTRRIAALPEPAEMDDVSLHEALRLPSAPPDSALRAAKTEHLRLRVPPQPPGPKLKSPAATAGWAATTLSHAVPPDVQLAVSGTHVVVGANDRIGIYDKAGNWIQTLTFQQLFAPLQPYGATDLPAIVRYNDGRVVFDEYRRRFWVLAHGGGPRPHPKEGINSDPSKWRAVLSLAVSRSEDPQDGWWTYWFLSTAHYGMNDGVWKPGDEADYPCLGVSPTAVHMTIGVVNQTVVNGEIVPVPATPRYQHVVLADAKAMVNHQKPRWWEFWTLSDPVPGSTPAGVHLLQPAVHHGPSGYAYYASRRGTDQIVVWGLYDPLGPQQKMHATTVTLPAFQTPGYAPQPGAKSRINMKNLYTQVMKAVYRWPVLYLVTHDALDWAGNGTPLSSVRFVRLYLGKFPEVIPVDDPVFVSRTFGYRSDHDDPPGAGVHYGWAALEVAPQREAAIVYARSAESVYPEMRYSLYPSKGPDIWPSTVLHKGEGAYMPDLLDKDGNPGICRWGDTAGASIDPNDGSIWLAHQYATKAGGYQIWVSRVAP